MIVNRLPAETHPIETEFGKLYAHVRYGSDGRPVGLSISHQIKDMNSQIAELIDDIANGLDGALRP